MKKLSMSKAELKELMAKKAQRSLIIGILDDEDAWAHVIMNYIDFATRFESGIYTPFTRRLCKKLNAALDDSSQVVSVVYNQS